MTYRQGVLKILTNNNIRHQNVTCMDGCDGTWMVDGTYLRSSNNNRGTKESCSSLKPWAAKFYCCSCFIEGSLPPSKQHDGAFTPSDSLWVWEAKAPHLSILHLSCPSPPCCLQLHKHHYYRPSWESSSAPWKTEMVKQAIFLLAFPSIYIWSCI